MKNCIIISLFVFISALGIYAQRPTTAIKVDEFDLKAEGLDAFEARATAFLKVLAGTEKTTRGLITIYENEEAAAKLNELLSKDRDLRNRIDLFVPGLRYDGEWKEGEFWLVPAGADSPYVATCSLCDCPSVSILGQDEFQLSLDTLVTFTAEVSGGSQDEIQYSWTVKGGEIGAGQGTPSITVKPTVTNPQDITATLELKGLDSRCDCPKTATSKSKLRL